MWIERHVTPEVAEAVRDAKLPGIEVAREPRRWYPGEAVAGPVIGRADIDGNGLDGIELAMNELLVGTRGAVKALRDARGRKMFADGLAQPRAPGATRAADARPQHPGDRRRGARRRRSTKNKAKNGVAVVLDVATGQRARDVELPDVRPELRGNVHGARNRAGHRRVRGGLGDEGLHRRRGARGRRGERRHRIRLGPGSVVRVGRSRSPTCTPSTYLTIERDHQGSSNVGAAKIALRLGAREAPRGTSSSSGSAPKTGIELPGEQAGKMRNGSTWRDIELATMAFGYGLTVTPLQIAAALAAIGNGGVYHAPRIVEEVVDADGTVVYRGRTAEAQQMVSSQTAGEMRAMLASRVREGTARHAGGTAKDIVVPGFRCGGKTGTAHKYDPATKKYADRSLPVVVRRPRADRQSAARDRRDGRRAERRRLLRRLGRRPGVRDGRERGAALPRRARRDARVPARRRPASRPARRRRQADGRTVRQRRPAQAGQEAGGRAAAAPARADDRRPSADPEPRSIEIPDFRGMGVGRALDDGAQARTSRSRSSDRVTSIEQDPAPGPTAEPVRVKLTFLRRR